MHDLKWIWDGRSRFARPGRAQSEGLFRRKARRYAHLGIKAPPGRPPHFPRRPCHRCPSGPVQARSRITRVHTQRHSGVRAQMRQHMSHPSTSSPIASHQIAPGPSRGRHHGPHTLHRSAEPDMRDSSPDRSRSPKFALAAHAGAMWPYSCTQCRRHAAPPAPRARSRHRGSCVPSAALQDAMCS